MGAEAVGPTWAALLAGATARLRAAGIESPGVSARRIVESASGWEGGEHALHLHDLATPLGTARHEAMVDRRARGEPLQYVLGAWGFRTLDLMVDRRVLIPRPETEQVVDVALRELDHRGRPEGRRATVVDLGTGSGAIALSLVAERPWVEVWGTDVSADAIDVARANLAGIGRTGTRVRLAQGPWFAALPQELRGRIDLVVSNPPYVASGEDLPAEVADWEPLGALVAGPEGTEAIEAIVGEAPAWLARPGVIVLELAPHQAEAVTRLVRRAGFDESETVADLAGRARVVVGRLR